MGSSLNLVSYVGLTGKDFIETSGEVRLIIALGRCLSCCDMVLDLSDVRFSEENVFDGKKMLTEFKDMVRDGIIYTGSEVTVEEPKRTGIIEAPVVYSKADISYFKEVKVFDELDDGKVFWNLAWAKKNYGSHAKDFVNVLDSLPKYLMSLVAWYLVSKYCFGKPYTGFVFSIDEHLCRNVSAYIEVYSDVRELPRLHEEVDLRVSEDIDLSYLLFIHNSRVRKRTKYKENDLYSVSEKKDFMKKLGMVEGSILVLFTRTSISASTPEGKIKSSKLIRLNEIGDTYLGYTEIYVNKTKEEYIEEFNELNETTRALVGFMEDKRAYTKESTMTIYSFGIDGYFNDEEYLLLCLDPGEVVYKSVMFDGKVQKIKMSGIDAIYWLLREYDIPFDCDLFKKMYSSGKTLLWDVEDERRKKLKREGKVKKGRTVDMKYLKYDRVDEDGWTY